MFMFKYNKEMLPPVFSNYFSYNKSQHAHVTTSN